MLKTEGMKAVVKKKDLYSPRGTRGTAWILHWPTNIGLWMTGKELYGQMKLKLIIWGQMEGNGCGKRQERG